MESDKVVPWKKGETIPGIRNEPSEDVIVALENLLDLARSGEIIGVAYVSFWHDKSVGSCYVGRLAHSAVGMMFSLMNRLSKDLNDEENIP